MATLKLMRKNAPQRTTNTNILSHSISDFKKFNGAFNQRVIRTLSTSRRRGESIHRRLSCRPVPLHDIENGVLAEPKPMADFPV